MIEIHVQEKTFEPGQFNCSANVVNSADCLYFFQEPGYVAELEEAEENENSEEPEFEKNADPKDMMMMDPQTKEEQKDMMEDLGSGQRCGRDGVDLLKI
ncbi:hypothetical protein RHMOL_Rhmol04G0003700 [Rhododendron molle]|uniref:Uncharacterized protein n=1 Tax=Rhododendron molle TaxID=49168 RepID=A0ACC0NXX0_RHOML|nr:hypothetical protein RHMOL_Rhmol04G0003700 [Rhododendron molle]